MWTLRDRVEPGRVQEALRETKQLIDRLSSKSGVPVWLIAKHLSNYASLLHLSGQDRQALQYFEQALELEGRAFGLSSPQTISTLLQMGDVAIQTGSLKKAEEFFLSAKDSCQLLQERDREIEYNVFLALTNLYERMGKKEARQLYAEKALGVKSEREAVLLRTPPHQ